MRRVTLVGLLATAGAVLAPADSAARVDDPPVSRAPAPALLGVYHHAGRRPRLAKVDARTLAPASRRVPLRGVQWTAERSPDGRLLAVAVGGSGKVQVVDLRRMRTRRTIHVGSRAPGMRNADPVRRVAWVRRDRIVAFAGWQPLEYVAVIDPIAGRVVARHRIPGSDEAVARIRAGLAILQGPQRGAGPARLLVATPDGPPTRIALPKVQAGFHHAPGPPPDWTPGLAVDDDADVAYVVAAHTPLVARVELSSNAVTIHALPVRARAAKGGEGAQRNAAWLGAGRLVYAGSTTADNGRITRIGVHVLDVSTWQAEIVSPAGAVLPLAGGGFVATDYGRTGFSVHAEDGRRLRTALDGRPFSDLQVAGRRAYAVLYGGRYFGRRGRPTLTHVVDLDTGRLERTLRGRPPALLG